MQACYQHRTKAALLCCRECHKPLCQSCRVGAYCPECVGAPCLSGKRRSGLLVAPPGLEPAEAELRRELNARIRAQRSGRQTASLAREAMRAAAIAGGATPVLDVATLRAPTRSPRSRRIAAVLVSLAVAAVLGLGGGAVTLAHATGHDLGKPLMQVASVPQR